MVVCCQARALPRHKCLFGAPRGDTLILLQKFFSRDFDLPLYCRGFGAGGGEFGSVLGSVLRPTWLIPLTIQNQKPLIGVTRVAFSSHTLISALFSNRALLALTRRHGPPLLGLFGVVVKLLGQLRERELAKRLNGLADGGRARGRESCAGRSHARRDEVGAIVWRGGVHRGRHGGCLTT